MQSPRREREDGNGRRDGQLSTYKFDVEKYQQRIHRHALTTRLTSLYPGENFKHLDIFLSRATQPGRGSALSESKEHDEPWALCYKLQIDDKTVIPKTMRSPFFPPTAPDHLLPNDTGVIFIRGYPCAKAMLELGAAYDIDPEFYRRHLCFLDDAFVNNETSLLPSSHGTMFQLHITTVGQHITQQYKSLLEKRRERAEQMDNYCKELCGTRYMGRLWRPAESVVRSFAVHDLEEFSMQQTISIHVSYNADQSTSSDRTWKAIIWTDGGAELNSSHPGPWNLMAQNLQCDPTILYKPGIALRNHDFPKLRPNSEDRRKIGQSILLLPSAFGRSLHPQIMREDPFYALTEIFEFYATSEMHFLDSIERLVRRSSNQWLETFQYLANDDRTHKDLSFFRTLLDQHIKSISETNSFVKSRERLRWPRSHLSKADRASYKIESDIEALLERAENLRERCNDGIKAIMANLQIVEARDAILQAKRTHTLTLLATLFLPATATATIFGMNFVQFPNPSEGALVWILVTLPFLVYSFAVVRWDVRFGFFKK